MAGYNEIKGLRVKYLSADPAGAEDGQVWYNSTTGNLRLQGVGVGAWSSASSLITAVREQTGFGSTQNAQASAGGFPNVTTTEEYNGSGWSLGGSMSSGRGVGAPAGTQTSGLVAGGEGPSSGVNTTEEYNGTSWTSGGNLPATVRFNTGFGTQTAAVSLGGMQGPSPGAKLATANKYDGSSWTATGSLNTARRAAATGGSFTSGIAMGGDTPPYSNVTEEFDGSTFSNGGNLNTTRGFAGGSAATQDAAITFGGSIPPGGTTTATENYDGSSWTTSPATLSVSRYGGHMGVTAPNTSTIYYGGQPPVTASTEEYNFSSSTVTAAAWASGGNLNTARQRAASAGASQTSALAFGGFEAPPNGPPLNNSETYNGTAWSEGNNLGTARGNTSGFGTATAAVCGPGRGTPSGPFIQNTEEYDGTSWTAGNTSNTSGAAARSASGTLTAGLICGGFTPPSAAPAEHVNNVEEYDGTNWTNATVMPQYQAYNCQCGTQTATLNGGGNAGPNGPTVNTNAISLDYDGTNWTAGPNANILSDKFTAYNGGTGTQTSALFVGGDGTITARFDGTAFSTDASYPAARGETNSAGSAPSNSALVYAGSPVPGVGNSTIEYSAETTTVNPASNITTS